MKIEIEIPDGPYDYNTAAEAMSEALLETEKVVAEKLGLTGFQFGWAQMNYLAESRSLDAGGILLDFKDFCYPQYDLHEKLDKAIQKSREQIISFAEKEVKGMKENAYVSAEVLEYMQRIANGEF